MRAADIVTETLDAATPETAIQEIGTHATWAANPEMEGMVDARARRICRGSACTMTETTATSKTRESFDDTKQASLLRQVAWVGTGLNLSAFPSLLQQG